MVQVGSIILNGTDGSSTDAGDNIILNATDSGGTDADGNISLEDGTSGYSVISAPTKTELAGGTDDYALTAGEYESAYDRFEDTESLDVNLILGGRGGGAGDTSSSQDTHVTMLTALVEKRRIALLSYHLSDLQQLVYPHLTPQRIM